MGTNPSQRGEVDERQLRVLRVADDARAPRGVLQALDEPVGRALERPQRHEHLREYGGPGRVRVHVAVDVEAAGDGGVDHAERRLDLAPVEVPQGLVVRQLDGDAGALADLERLGHRLDQVVSLVAHVGRVQAPPRRDGLRDAHELVGLRVGPRGEHEARRQAEGTLVHAARDELAHRADLRLGGRPLGHAHHGAAHVAVRDERRGVHGDAGGPEARAVVRERGGARRVAARLAEDERQEARVHRVDLRVRGLQPQTAVAHDLGRHALEHLGLRLRVGREREVAVGVHVDEAGSDHQITTVERLVRR